MEKKRLFALAVCAVIYVGTALPALADTIITKDGTKYEGYIVRETDADITIFVKDLGEVTIPKKGDNIVQHIKPQPSTEPEGDKKDAKSGDKKDDAATEENKEEDATAGKATTKKTTTKKATTKKATTPKKKSKK